MPASGAVRTFGEQIERTRAEPVPFLSILHAIQEQFGHIPEEAVDKIAGALSLPKADLFGTISFYHFFRLEPGDAPSYVCGGPVCALKGIPEGHRISCPGRCDQPVPVLKPDGVFVDSRPIASPLPAGTGTGECLFTNIRKGGSKPDPGLLGAVRADPERHLKTLKESGLAGRGGAAFPTGVKWEAVRNDKSDEKYIICNADEGEPGCFKDRVLMDHDPVAVIEGMALAGAITGAKVGIIYLRYEYPETLPVLQKAIDAADYGEFRIYIRRGAGAYICGEETSLLNSLEGLRPFPRNKPPYPTTHGLFGRPTVVNNVETFAAVPPILRNGADWYRGLGLGDNAGTKIFSVSGDVRRPGNYELPLGTPLRELLDTQAGGSERGIKAVTMAGVSGGFLGGADLDVNLDIPSIRDKASFLGAGGIIVYDTSRCMVRAAQACMKFFADESCGKCFPCRIGTVRSTEILDEILAGKPRDRAQDEMSEIGRVMGDASACGLGVAAPLVTRSLIRYWPDEVKAHMEGRCTTGECR